MQEDQNKIAKVEEHLESGAERPLSGSKAAFDPTVDPFIGYEFDDKYRVISLLGSGAWGSVYRGVHLALGSDIAIKIMHKHLSKDEANLKRLTQEAQLLNGISNSHVVKLMDFGVKPVPFIVMEYFDGITLAEHLRSNGALAVETALQLFSQLCEGLSSAHRAGFIHRDLKPSNIMLKQNDGRLDSRILDLGIAKLLDLSEEKQALTATGEILGSPPYMSPEQWTGICDQRSDLYSLGCIMYEALTGKLAFEAHRLQ
jgi:serine/threonine-protein kinase